MMEVPPETPSTLPEVPIVATDGEPLVQEPPAEPSPRGMDAVTQTGTTPEIGAGSGLTLCGAVIIQPVGSVYVIVAGPEATPVTVPVEPTTVAIAVLLLAQVPPVLASVSVTEEPGHTDARLPIAAGSGLTVTTIELVQPDEVV